MSRDISRLIRELVKHEWEFYASHDDKDYWYLSVILGNDEHIIQTGKQARDVLNEIKKYW